jgi:multiple sugar transport system substrate-binding protein
LEEKGDVLMLKKLSPVISLALIFIIVFGNSPITTKAQGPEPVTLRFSWWGNPTRDERTNQVIALFEEQYPWITVEAESSSWDDYWVLMQSQGEGGNLPDLIQNDYSRIQTWVANGWLYPLDEFIADGTIDLSNVSEPIVNSGQIDDQQYGISVGSNSLGIMLDLDDFEAADMAIPAEDWTWNDFEQVCLDLHETLDKWCIGGNTVTWATWWSVPLGYGESFYTPDHRALGYTHDQAYIDLLNMFLRLQDAGAVPSHIEASDMLAEDAIIGGQASMADLWSNMMIGSWNQAGENRHFKMIHLPRPADGCCSSNYLKPSQFFTIGANSEHPEEAAMLIDFLTNSLEANRILLGERGVPISSVVREDLTEYVSPAQVEMFDFLSRVEEDNSPLPAPDPVVHQQIYEEVYLPRMIDPVMLSEITPEEGVAAFREDATLILSSQ